MSAVKPLLQVAVQSDLYFPRCFRCLFALPLISSFISSQNFLVLFSFPTPIVLSVWRTTEAEGHNTRVGPEWSLPVEPRCSWMRIGVEGGEGGDGKLRTSTGEMEHQY